MIKVCKFGGTSLASTANILKMAEIVQSDPSRKYIVVSAPGKRDSNDIKITDMLIECSKQAKTGSCAKAFSGVIKRFEEIVKELKLTLDISVILANIQNKIDELKGDYDYTVSRGEYLNAVIIANLLGYEFVDAKDFIKFDINGEFSPEYTWDIATETLKNVKCAVIPGFYGSMPNKKIKTFSRGGSDISGSIVARAVMADVYENFTDVDGVLSADPRIVKDPKPIRNISYRELRELAYMGASVLHADAIFPVRTANIPIHLKSTFLPDGEGTLIMPDQMYEEKVKKTELVTGIAGKKDYLILLIQKSMMNAEKGFTRKILSVLERYGICFEHIPTGIDTMSIVISKNEFNDNLDEVVEKIKIAVDPDMIKVIDDIALIATVGHGMANQFGTAARLFTAISNAKVNVKVIDQGSSELNIIVAVKNNDFEKTIQAIYTEFKG